jgi:hypothetical protein
MSTNRGITPVDPAVRPGRNPSASRLETTDRLVRGITGAGSTRVSYRLGKIKITGSGMPFSGTAYVAGYKTTGLGTKAWVRCFLDKGTAEDHDGPAPNPFPPNEEWYEVSATSGDIHESRA